MILQFVSSLANYVRLVKRKPQWREPRLPSFEFDNLQTDTDSELLKPLWTRSREVKIS